MDNWPIMISFNQTRKTFGNVRKGEIMNNSTLLHVGNAFIEVCWKVFIK